MALRGQGVTHDEIPLLDPKTDQLHTAAIEGFDIGGGGKAKQAGDLDSRSIFRVDDHVDAQFLLEGGQLGGVFHVAHPGDDVLGAQPFGGQAADHVHLVHTGGGNDHVRRIRAGFPQGGDGSAVPLDAHHIQRLRGTPEGVVVGIDDGDVMLLLGEVLRQSEAYLTVSHDDDLQTKFILSGKTPHTFQLIIPHPMPGCKKQVLFCTKRPAGFEREGESRRFHRRKPRCGRSGAFVCGSGTAA